MGTSIAKPNTTRLVFQHWLNLSYLAGLLMGGLIGGWWVFLLGTVVEGLALWMAPDFPGVQRALENAERRKRIEQQRAHYAKVLWNLEPVATNPFVAPAPNWVELTADHERYGRNNQGRTAFHQLCRTVADLRFFQSEHPDEVSEDFLIRIEEKVNGFLSLLSIAKTTSDMLAKLDQRKLAVELANLRKIMTEANPADQALRVIHKERLRALKTSIESRPRLERRQALASAQAENVIQNIETMALQLKTQGAVELGAMVDTGFDLMEVDTSVDMLEVATEVRALTDSSGIDVDDPAIWAELEATLNTGTANRLSDK